MNTQSPTKAKNPSLLPVIITFGVALILTFFFLTSLRNDTPVVVAAQPVSVGGRLTKNDLEIKMVRRADALPGALTKVEDAVGEVISVQRLPGDQVTASMLGSKALSAIAASLAPDHRAVGVKVTRSSGLVGIVRPGDYVTLIAVVEPTNKFLNTITDPFALATPDDTLSGTPAPTSTPPYSPVVPESPFARVTATGLKVLLVPQTFRYEEVTTTNKGDDSGGFVAAQSSTTGLNESVLLLDVPVAPVTVAGIDGASIDISLPELIALLDSYAQVYLALEPPTNAAAGVFPGVAIEQIVDMGVGQ